MMKNILGDMGYPLEPWLMNSLPNETPGTSRFAYNEVLCKTRNGIERAFGVMKNTWRCLSRHRVCASTVLQNMKCQYREPVQDNVFQYEPIINDGEYETEGRFLLSVARRIQNQIITQYFS